MEIRMTCLEALPPLAWVLRLDTSGAVAWHGRGVLTGDQWLFDGVWAGDAGSDDFLSSERFGCGVSADLHGLRLATPSAPIDRIIVCRSGSGTWVSNSLPLILGVLDDRLDPENLHYRSAALSRELGLRLKPLSLATLAGNELRFLIGEEALLRWDGSLDAQSTPRASPFRDFAHYQDHLQQVVGSVRANAEDDRRPQKFPPLPLLSTGYDSTAVTVLARDVGVREALTMRRYDESTGELVDHPGASAATLGIDLIELERGEWRNRSDLREAILAAAGLTMMDVSFLDLDEHLGGRTLLAGYSGDILWDPNNPRVYAEAAVTSAAYSGRGLAEWRLRRSFVIAPIPSIAQSAHPSIQKISVDSDMRPWWVDGSYNRPIPRRIAEEAGLERGSFATKKWAGSARVGNRQTRFLATTTRAAASEVDDFLSAAATQSFLSFVEDHGGPSAMGDRTQRLGHRTYQKLDALNVRVGRVGSRVGIRTLVPRRAMITFGHRHRVHRDYTDLLPHWGTDVVIRNERDVVSEIRELARTGPAHLW